MDLGVIGRGGGGTVRRVLDPRLLRQTALKHVAVEDVHPSALAQFYEEVRIAGQLEHPNMVPVYEVGPDGQGGLYATMKLVEGETLADRLAALGTQRLDPDKLAELIGLLIRACDAIAHAHDRGVVHCDLKPENILLGRYGAVYVADWGTAQLLPGSALTAWSGDRGPAASSPGGTPGFLSPEQAMGDPTAVGTHTDVFGVGAILYAILSGGPLYGDCPPAEAVFRAVTGEIVPIEARPGGRSLPRRLRAICTKALSRDPAGRQKTVLELRGSLEQFLRGTWQMPSRAFAAGHRVVTEGEHGDCAYVVQSGRLAVFSEHGPHRLPLRELGPGDVFGEMAILGDGRRSATVETLTPVKLLEVSAEALQDGLGLNTWIGSFVTGMADRFREVDRAVRSARASQIPASQPKD